MKQFLGILSIILLLSFPALAWEYDDDHSDDYQSSYDREETDTFRDDQEEEEFLPIGSHYDNHDSYEITPDGRLRDTETLQTYDEDERLPSGYQWEQGPGKTGNVRVHY